MIKFEAQAIVVKLFITVSLDNIDHAILESLRNSSHGRTASQISAILEYNGFSVTIGELRERLRKLATISVIAVQKGSRHYRYNLLIFNSS